MLCSYKKSQKDPISIKNAESGEKWTERRRYHPNSQFYGHSFNFICLKNSNNSRLQNSSNVLLTYCSKVLYWKQTIYITLD